MSNLDNAFFYVDSVGLPLEMVMRAASKHGHAVNLSAFMLDAAKAGWSYKKALSACNDAVNSLNREHVLFGVEGAGE